MPELRVVAVSNDGTRLVLKAADSTEYTLPIDERLRAAVRGDRPRLGQIDDFYKSFTPNNALARAIWSRLIGSCRQITGVGRGEAPHGDGPETLAIIGPHQAERRLAQSQCLFEHCVEDRGEIAGRGIDDLQYLGDGTLSRQRPIPLGSALCKVPLEFGDDLLRII